MRFTVPHRQVIEGDGAGAGRFESSRAEFVGELQNAHYRPQAIEGPLAEQPTDDLARRGSDFLGATQAAGGRRKQARHFRRRQVIGIRQPLSAPGRPGCVATSSCW